jgi:hypothetical protein
MRPGLGPTRREAGNPRRLGCTHRLVRRPFRVFGEQHVHALEQHGVDVQEVAGKDAVCPGAREPPTR